MLISEQAVNQIFDMVGKPDYFGDDFDDFYNEIYQASPLLSPADIAKNFYFFGYQKAVNDMVSNINNDNLFTGRFTIKPFDKSEKDGIRNLFGIECKE